RPVPQGPSRLRSPRPTLRVHQLLRGAGPAAQAGHVQALGPRGRRRARRAAGARRQAPALAAVMDTPERQRGVIAGVSPTMTVRDAVKGDLPAIVEIYNAAIPGRMATADTEPVSVESRQPWFDE